jgi:transcriptional regulator with XRE-family HTH domain
LNRKLGFSGNQIYRWEKGLRSVDWADFVKLCQILNVDLLQIFKVQFGYMEKKLDSVLIVKHLLGPLKMKEAVEVTGFSRSILTKWMKGATSPQLHHILQLIEQPNHLILTFTKELGGEGRIDGLEKYKNHVQKLKEFHYQEPMLVGIVAFLETPRFDSKKEFVRAMAQIFRVDTARIESILERMVQMGLIKTDSDVSKVTVRTVDTRGSFEGSVGLRKFWTGYVLQTLENLSPQETSHLFPFFVFCVSEEANRKLREAHYQYASLLKAIIEEDCGDKTIVRAISIGDIELKEP